MVRDSGNGYWLFMGGCGFDPIDPDTFSRLGL